MTDRFVPRHQQKVHTWGSPFHGLNINGTLTLSNNETIYKAIDGSKRRFGDCYAIEVPGHTYADSFDVPSHLKFESYALNSGFENKSLYNTKIEYADKRKFLYCDDNKDRWLVTISPGVGGTATAITMGITLKKFGDFITEDPEVYTYTLNVGNPAISTALNGYTYEVVNVSKSGNLAIIGLCLENSTTESLSTNIFDRQYGYPLAFIRLDLTSKTTQTASIYRSKTYCERTPTITNRACINATFVLWSSVHTIIVKKTLSPYTQISKEIKYGEMIEHTLRNPGSSTYYYNGYEKLPNPTVTYTQVGENTVEDRWGFETINVTWQTVGGTGGSRIDQTRLIHVFISDDNTLTDVECSYSNYTSGYNLYCTDKQENCLTIAQLNQIVLGIKSTVSDNRYSYQLESNAAVSTGSVTYDIPIYSASKTGAETIYELKINSSVVSGIKCNGLSISTVNNLHVTIPINGARVETKDSAVVTTDNSYTGPTSGTITAVPLTSYKNYKGWMSKGTYTIDGSKFVTPFIQLYTNNLVGMIEGNAYTSNPDNAHWDTGSGGTMIAMPIYGKDGTQVSAGGTIDALTRYCSYHPVNHTFSGLYDVPVCYV